MARQLIFLVHGVGDEAKGWSSDIQTQIKSLYSAYDISKDFPFDTFFEFREITYNDRFDALRAQWRTNSDKVLATLKQGGLDKTAAGRLSAAGGAAGGQNAVSTHVFDVVLYKFVPTIAEAIRASVAKQFLAALVPSPGAEVPSWSMIAHSLGTAVAHDTLHALFTSGKPTERSVLAQGRVLMMLANVSRLLQQDGVEVYKSAVRPSGPAGNGICRFFVNAKHEWDPIPRPREFRPLDDWPDVASRQEHRYVPVTINAFQSKNIHAFTHYLSNPKVHVEFFRRLFSMEGTIPEAERVKASALYEASTPFGQFQELQTQLKAFQIEEEASWGDIIEAFQDFFDTVKAF